MKFTRETLHDVMNKKSCTLFVLAVFFTLLLSTMVQQGLFMDGLIYSAVAHNMANGIGTFWAPVFSSTTLNPFYEHPPLALGMQSVFFSLLGHSFLIEKMYSLLMALAMLIIVKASWQEASGNDVDKRRGWWMPVLLWITVPICFWCYRNNMLENTIARFSALAFYLILRQRENKHVFSFYHVLAGVLVFCGFLSKGLPALFPLAAPFIIALCLRPVSLARGIYQSLQVTFACVSAAVLVYFTTDFATNFSNYLEIQVTPSLTGQTVVGRRTVLLEVLAMQVIGHAALVLVIYLVHAKWVKRKKELTSFNKRMIATFLLVGLSALLPMMVSPKQLGFYIMPCLPYLSIALSIWLFPMVAQIGIQLENWKYFRSLNGTVSSLIFVPVIVVAIFFGEISRDKNHLPDVILIGEMIGQHTTISASEALYPDWRLMGYFQRFYFIAIDRNGKELEYHILNKDEAIPEHYVKVDLNLISLKLVKRQS
ncbi:MAG: ArnT family glycosyltransferase [Flavobacteriales bacterium]